jgi:hypothetical protein
MDKPDSLVTTHLADRLLKPERLKALPTAATRDPELRNQVIGEWTAQGGVDMS